MESRRKSIVKVLEKGQHQLRMIKLVRTAKRSDIPKIEQMVNNKTKSFFGDVNIGDLICTSFLSAVMEDYENNIIACVCVNNFPNVPSIPPWCWRPWLRNLYKISYVNSRNSLWGHLAVFHIDYALIFLYKILVYIYTKCNSVEYILFVKPPRFKSTEWLNPHGIFISPPGIHPFHSYNNCNILNYDNPAKLQTIFLTKRCDFTVSYKIRRAVEQDNDDIVTLINRYSTRFKKIYGEFYIAELLQKHHSNRHVIVAEHEGCPVAVMILNNELNYDMVNHAFKLETFYGLKKPDHRDLTKFMEHEHAVQSTLKQLDSLSLVTAPEKLERSGAGIFSTQHDPSKAGSDETLSIADDFELPMDVQADLDIIMSQMMESDDESGNDSESFVGTLEDQVGCVILSYTVEEYDKWTRKGNFKGSISNIQIYHPIVPHYHGEDNAFTLEVVASQPGHDRALQLLLEASFECFPNKDYCALCIPSTEVIFPLLKTFVRVTPRPSSNFENELYVAHRCVILSDISVREATMVDRQAIENLVEKLKVPVVFNRFLSSVNILDSKYRSYLFVCNSHVFGFAILSEQDNIEYINSHYQLTTWTDITKHKVDCHGAIDFFVMSPIFSKHSRFILQELHRLSGFTILYYMIFSEELANQTKHVACVLDSLLPVVPAHLSECEKAGTEYWKLPDVLFACEKPFALYISTPLHCGLSRHEVNTKIVVVGASDVALAFLVELIFKNNPYYRVTFNNITLVSPHGICRQKVNRIRDIFIPSRSVLHGYYLNLLSLKTYVNIVNGVMSAINRKDKTITVNRTFLPYDLLFLMCGKQYQMPQRAKKQKKTSEFPDNVYIINTEVDADIALTKVNRIINRSVHSKYTIIVYGHNLETLSCLAALIEFGIPSNNLVFVDPIPRYAEIYSHKLIFDDGDIEEAIFNEIKLLGIEIYSGYHFIDWSFDEECNGITSVTFESKHRIQEIKCIGMFAYTNKMISMRTFLAINRAGLIFDGGLVVDPNCQTNDSNIYAAGAITKYPRRYYADHKIHEYYNQEEIGRKLAEHISRKLLATVRTSEEDALFAKCKKPESMTVSLYTDPLIEYTELPGKLYYLNVRKPGIPIPHDVAMTADDYGQVLISGNCKSLDRQGYFRLHLNQRNLVETITCLAKFPIQKVNLSCLWGKHERLLNNLVQRFEMVLIRDLYEFFKEEWTYLIYHDNFKKLSAEMDDILTFTDEDGRSFVQEIYRIYEENDLKPLSVAQHKELKKIFLNSKYKDAIMEKLLNFFGDHMLYLPMYAHPLLISIILGGYEESPFFKKM